MKMPEGAKFFPPLGTFPVLWEIARSAAAIYDRRSLQLLVAQ
jgi:hypothetical protein